LRRRQVHDVARQAAQPRQRRRPVEVGHDGNGPGRAQFGAARRLAGQREHAEAPDDPRQQAHADIAATDDQEARPPEGACARAACL
jgi:hypothetical protein